MKMKPANIAGIVAKLIAAVMLFVALGRHPYDYYTLLRWVGCGVCAYTAFQSVQKQQPGWLCVFAISAVLLNPIAPVHLKRDNWAIVDSAVAVLLLVSIATLDISKAKRSDEEKFGQNRKKPPDKPDDGLWRN